MGSVSFPRRWTGAFLRGDGEKERKTKQPSIVLHTLHKEECFHLQETAGEIEHTLQTELILKMERVPECLAAFLQDTSFTQHKARSTSVLETPVFGYVEHRE